MAKAFVVLARRHDRKNRSALPKWGRDLYAFTAEGDPNSGVIIGMTASWWVEAQATPAPGAKGDRPLQFAKSGPTNTITHLALTAHYHAVRGRWAPRVLCAAG